MKHQRSTNAKKPKPFAAVAELEETAPLDDPAAAFVPSADQVAERAYLKFQNQGEAEGHDVDHWLRSETELIAEHQMVGR